MSDTSQNQKMTSISLEISNPCNERCVHCYIPHEYKLNDMSDELFDQYDELIQMDEPLTFEEAEMLVTLFSDDCDDLNWGLLHTIESVGCNNIERYRKLISKCNNPEFRETLEIRLNNTLEKNK